jgi:putative ABC transport system permease protein
METLVRDLRFAGRMFTRSPGLTFGILLTLAIGIGCTVGVFSVVNAVMLRPLPYREPEQIVVIRETDPTLNTGGGSWGNVSPADFVDWRSQSESFEQVSAFDKYGDLNLTGEGEPELIHGVNTTATLFPLLGVQPLLGRWFTVEEEERGDRVVELSYSLWKRKFGGREDVLDRNLSLNGRGYNVVGVMPPEFRIPSEAEIWIPAGFGPGLLKQRNILYLNVVARLKAGIKKSQAQAEMNTICARLQEQYPATNSQRGAEVAYLRDHAVGGMRPPLVILLAAAGILLCITCANVANLLLAHTISRDREIAIRCALGASQGDIVRQLLTESLSLGVLGGTIGLMIAAWGTQSLMVLYPGHTGRIAEVKIDGRVLTFTLGMSLLAGLIFGAFPAFRPGRPNLTWRLKEGGRHFFVGAGRGWGRNMLVALELALCLVLLICSGLLVRSFIHLVHLDSGLEEKNLLTLQLRLSSVSYRTRSEILAFEQTLREGIARLPGVTSVATSSHMPFEEVALKEPFSVEGVGGGSGENLSADHSFVSSNYFTTLSVPLVQGRTFAESDSAQGAKAIIINRAMADRFFRGRDPVGSYLRLSDGDYEVIGVVGNVRNLALESEVHPEMFGTPARGMSLYISVFIRCNRSAISIGQSAREAVRSLNSEQPIYDIQTMEGRLPSSAAKPYFIMVLLGIFGVIALTLSAVGVYGLVSYTASQRTREIGIRMALGARRGMVLGHFVKEGMIVTIIGVAMGLFGSIAASRALKSMLYGVDSRDSVAFLSGTVILLVIALVGCYVPARRASRADPAAVLRGS